MKRYFLAVLVFLCTTVILHAQEIATADKILQDAYQRAAKENKNVFLIFHASWCGWCRKMDSSIHDPSVKSFFEKSYVITHLTVKESANKKHLENAGAEQFLIKHGGGDKGIPFWIVLDKRGNVLADSNMKPGVNSGCPATKEEVAHLINVLEKTSAINNDQKVAVEKRFRGNE